MHAVMRAHVHAQRMHARKHTHAHTHASTHVKHAHITHARTRGSVALSMGKVAILARPAALVAPSRGACGSDA